MSNEEEKPRKSFYKYLNRSQFLAAFSRVIDTQDTGGKGRDLLTPGERELIDEIALKCQAAARKYLNGSENVSPAKYLQAMDQARAMAPVLILCWRDNPRGMRPGTVDGAAAELGEIAAGLAMKDFDQRQVQKELAEIARENAAIDAEHERLDQLKEWEKNRAAAAGELAELFARAAQQSKSAPGNPEA